MLFLNLDLELFPAGLDIDMIFGRLNAGFLPLVTGNSLINPLEDFGLVLFEIGTGTFCLRNRFGSEDWNGKE